MKKLTWIFALALLCCLHTVSACAQTDFSVSIWGNQTRTDRTAAALKLYESEHPGTSVELRPFAWGDYWTMLDVQAAGGALPDVIQMDYQYLNLYADSQQLVDLMPYVDSGALNLADVHQGIIESGMMDGCLYAVCIGVNAPALLYNKTLLDSVGITVRDYMTMDEFTALCRDVYEQTGYKTNIGYGIDMVMGYYMRGLGVELFKDGRLNASVEDIAQFFSLYEQGIREGWHVSSEVFAEVSIGAVDRDPMVYGGDPATRSWCGFFWSNQMTALQAIAVPQGIELGITTWPSPDPFRSNYLKPSQFFSVSSASENIDAAVSLIDFFTNSVPCNEILLGERGIPASSIASAAIAPQMDEANQKVISYMNEVVSPIASAAPAADPVGATEFFAVVSEMLQSLCYGQISAEDAAAYLVNESVRILK